jgi:hypothetical protein
MYNMPAYFMPDFAPFSGAALACRRQKAYSYDENVLPSPSSASSHMDLHEDSDAAQEILAQLAEAKRACESLERELELERQAGMFNLPKKKDVMKLVIHASRPCFCLTCLNQCSHVYIP